MNIKSTIALYATAAGGQSTGSSLVPSDLPQQEKDIARRRLVKTNPDVDAAVHYKEESQTDNAAFIGKRLRLQDTKYGHIISEHDSSASAQQAMLARPYSRILRHPELSQLQQNRDLVRNKKYNV